MPLTSALFRDSVSVQADAPLIIRGPTDLRFEPGQTVWMGSDQLWVVAACFNEEQVITRFIDRVLALQEVDRLVLIDDGSSDSTVGVIRHWQQSHPDQGVTLLELTRNFGKEAAMLAGLD